MGCRPGTEAVLFELSSAAHGFGAARDDDAKRFAQSLRVAVQRTQTPRSFATDDPVEGASVALDRLNRVCLAASFIARQHQAVIGHFVSTHIVVVVKKICTGSWRFRLPCLGSHF